MMLLSPVVIQGITGIIVALIGVLGIYLKGRQDAQAEEIKAQREEQAREMERNAQERQERARDSEEARKQTQAVQAGVQALLRNELIERIKTHKQKGYISIYDRDNLDRMYAEYKNLKGNSTVTRLMAEIEDLPIYDSDELENIADKKETM